MKIGSLEIGSNLFLSPLAGFTNLAFRLVVRRIGGIGIATTDLVHARALLMQSGKTLDLIRTCPEDKPLGVQIFGGNGDELAAAAQWLENYGAALVDINMGCPVDKVVKCGAGSAMMRDLDTATATVSKVVRAVKIPVTVKMRLGWDDQTLSAHLLAPRLEEAGVAAIVIHGRTREQGFSGTVNLNGIRMVVESVKHIPIIGNGDVTHPSHAGRMIEETGCAGVMIGRGALANPWIFRDIQFFTKHGTVPPAPTTREKVEVMNFHFLTMVEQFSEYSACQKFRKMGIWYAKTLPNGKAFHRKIEKVSSTQQYHDIVQECLGPYLDSQGLQSEFTAEEQPRVAVPSGPVSLW